MYFPGDIWNIIKEYAIDCNLLWHISRTDSIDRFDYGMKDLRE